MIHYYKILDLISWTSVLIYSILCQYCTTHHMHCIHLSHCSVMNEHFKVSGGWTRETVQIILANYRQFKDKTPFLFHFNREMRCLRNKIHANLFLTYILANSCWILTAVMQDAHFQNTNVSLFFHFFGNNL